MHSRRITANVGDCKQAIEWYLEHCQETGERPTTTGYKKWYKDEPGTPSLGPIYKYLGSWPKAVKAIKAADYRPG